MAPPRRKPGPSGQDAAKTKRTPHEGYFSYRPHVLQPQDICWLLVAIICLKQNQGFSFAFSYHVLKILLRESLNYQPITWEDLTSEIGQVGSGILRDDGSEVDMGMTLRDYATHLNDPQLLQQFVASDFKSTVQPSKPEDPKHQHGIMRRSWIGLHARRIRLAYVKLSETAVVRFHRVYAAWISGNPRAAEIISPTDHQRMGYLVFETDLDRAPRADLQPYVTFERAQHTGDIRTAVESLRAFFDQRFTKGRNPPRQHALNALAYLYYNTGDVESARQVSTEAINLSRTSGDRSALLNIMSLARRLPPRPPPMFHHDPHGKHLRRVMWKREEEGTKEDAKIPAYETKIQLGTTPLDSIHDVRMGLNQGQPMSHAFGKLIEAKGCFDISTDNGLHPWSMLWDLLAAEGHVWTVAGLSYASVTCHRTVLTHAQGNSDSRLFSSAALARSQYNIGRYVTAWTFLFDPRTWQDLNLNQYQYWSSEIWELLWDIATRKGQDRFKREYLTPKRPPPSPYEGWEKDKKSVASIQATILEATGALRAKSNAQALKLILEALHYSELNGYWRLYRVAVPVFAELELQAGKIENAKARLDEILPQAVRGDDLELQGSVCALYAKVLLAQVDDPSEAEDTLRLVISFLDMAKTAFRKLEMYEAEQDVLYLLAVTYENADKTKKRDLAITEFREAEEKQKQAAIEMDEDMMAVWEFVCEVGVMISNGLNWDGQA